MLEKIENTLTKASSIPVIGIIPAAVKAVMGVAEVVAGVALGAFGVFATIFSGGGSSSLFVIAGAGIGLRGLANIVAGILEAIPLVGTASAFYLSSEGINAMHLITGRSIYE